MNPEPTVADSFDEAEWLETLLAEFCAPMSEIGDLDDADLVARAATDLIDGISHWATVDEFHPAFTRAVTSATLPAATLLAAEGHTEAEILTFLRQLLAELERRRPWPDPAFLEADATEWPSAGAGLPIGWVELPTALVEHAVKATFDESEDGAPVLVLRLRGGQLVALIGEAGDRPSRFVVVLPDADGQQDADDVIGYLVGYAGLPVRTEGVQRSFTMLSDL
ncbi:hypothetical protein [Nocardia sp. alder85J]|uniref:hypothetical protein n=1 Tax=Nocardia sp. alder85J TaxID=2862949 RepID=UPI001CD7B776|nr:hypothetical protein [Nocardia sp. alder85J]MCX4093068.1 hypothetical protein [Nocardia sp. alder85J]